MVSDVTTKIYVNDGTTTTQITKIVGGTLDLEEILVSDKLAVGELCSSKFEVQLYDCADLSGQHIEVYQQYGVEEPFPLFTGIIDSCTLTKDSNVRELVAYDPAYSLGMLDVAEWWNDFWEDYAFADIKTIRDSLCTFANIQFDSVTLPNDTIRVQKMVSVSSASFNSIMQMLCQFSGVFPHFDRTGTLKFLHLTDTTAVSGSLENNYEKGNSTFETTAIPKITGVQIYDSEGKLKYSVGTTDNVCLIENNVFFYTLSQADLQTVANNILSNINNISYVPSEIKLIVGHPDQVQVGQRWYTTQGTVYVLKLHSYGVQLVEATIESPGEILGSQGAKAPDFNSIVLNEKMSTITHTLDEFSSEIKVIEDNLKYECVPIDWRDRETHTETADSYITKTTFQEHPCLALDGRHLSAHDSSYYVMWRIYDPEFSYLLAEQPITMQCSYAFNSAVTIPSDYTYWGQFAYMPVNSTAWNTVYDTEFSGEKSANQQYRTNYNTVPAGGISLTSGVTEQTPNPYVYYRFYFIPGVITYLWEPSITVQKDGVGRSIVSKINQNVDNIELSIEALDTSMKVDLMERETYTSTDGWTGYKGAALPSWFGTGTYNGNRFFTLDGTGISTYSHTASNIVERPLQIAGVKTVGFKCTIASQSAITAQTSSWYYAGIRFVNGSTETEMLDALPTTTIPAMTEYTQHSEPDEKTWTQVATEGYLQLTRIPGVVLCVFGIEAIISTYEATSSGISVLQNEIRAEVSRATSRETELASSITQTAASITTEVNAAVSNLKIGAVNILRGTNTTTVLPTGSGYWANSGWSVSGSGTVTSINITNAPNANIDKGWRIVNSNSEVVNTSVRQLLVPVVIGQTYTLSCYAKGTGRLRLLYGRSSPYGTSYHTLTTDWEQYSYTFTIENDSSKVIDGQTNIYFGNNSSNGTVDICGMQLEKGSIATDWSPSPDDVSDSISTVEQTANSITLNVSNSDTSSTIQLLRNSAVVTSKNITFSGYVTFGNLSTSGQTTINGGNIKTGTLIIGGSDQDPAVVRVRDTNDKNIILMGTSGVLVRDPDGDDTNIVVLNGNGITVRKGTIRLGKGSFASTASGIYIGSEGISAGRYKWGSSTYKTALSIAAGGSPYLAPTYFMTYSASEYPDDEGTGFTRYGLCADKQNRLWYRGAIQVNTEQETYTSYFGGKTSFQYLDVWKDSYFGGDDGSSTIGSGGDAHFWKDTYIPYLHGAWTSDRRKKKDIANLQLEDSTNLILGLKPVKFKWIKEPDIHKPFFDEGVQHGFIAQDVEELDLDWSLITKVGEYLSLNYIEIIPDIVNVVQYLYRENQRLSTKLQEILDKE